jgi:serine protease DegS
MREIVRYVLVPAVVGAALGLAVTLGVFLANADNDKPGYAAAVRRAAPAVVNIYSAKALQPPICQQPWFQEWCERFRGDGRSQMQSSLGSGVVIRSDGYILTNNHVIEGADQIYVAFAGGQGTTARLVGSDPETDLAVIQIAATGLTPITLGNSNDVEVGDVTLAIGNPFGIGQTVSAGIISAKGRAGISRSPYDDFIQTDAAINPGNSGGALIDAEGRLIGINTLIYTRSGGSQGISFAIPVQLAVAILDEILETGKVTRGWLGIGLSNPVRGSGAGLLVTDVTPQGPAWAAGLLPGDRILAINRETTLNVIAASRLIARVDPGGQVSMNVLRGDRNLSVVATAAERPRLLSP